MPNKKMKLSTHDIMYKIQHTPYFKLQDDLDVSCNTSIKTPLHMGAGSRKSAGSSACLLDVMDGVSVDLCETPESPSDIPGKY